VSLLGAKLRALVRSRWGHGERVASELPGGATLLEGTSAWVLLDRDPVRAFGAALVWADRQGVTDLHVLAGADAGVLARRARCFEPPADIWGIEGTALVAAAPDPVPPRRSAVPAAALDRLLVDADVEVVVEDGIVRGEVNGLEVARVVHGVSTAGVPLDGPLLEVGVGQADRELTGMVHGAMDPVDQLARIVEIVRAQRRPGAPPHPLNRLVPERWLRALLMAAPARLGLEELRPIEAAVPRTNLRDRGVAAALGRTANGEEIVVVCSVGVDLDLVPASADTRLAAGPGLRLLIVVPERDAHPVTLELAARLTPPAEVVRVSDAWREWQS
jgi:hypothetical protein